MSLVMNRMNPMSLVMNQMNAVSLVGRIVCLCQLYGKNKQETHNIRNLVHKIESIIVYILKI